jgi:DNA polymerase-3 subunit beta
MSRDVEDEEEIYEDKETGSLLPEEPKNPKETPVMRFTVNRKYFANNLLSFKNVVPSSSMRDILRTICFVPQNGLRINIHATDMDIYSRITLDTLTSIDNPRSFLVDYNRLLFLATTDTSEEWKISVCEGQMIIKGTASKFNLSIAHADDFPKMDTPLDVKSIRVNAKAFSKAIERTQFCTSKDNARYATNGIHFNLKGNVMDVVATDTHRLSLEKVKVENDKNIEFYGISLVRGIKAIADEGLARAADMDNYEFTLNYTDNSLSADFEDRYIYVRLLDGQFPDYNRVIPNEEDTNSTVTFNCAELKSKLKTLSIFTDKDSKRVRLSFKDEIFTIRADTSMDGEGEIELTVLIKGDPEIGVCFNSIYLQDAINAVGDDEISLQMKDPSTPALIRSTDGFTHIIMPIVK